MEKQQKLSKLDLIELKNTLIENREFFKSNENIGNFNFIPDRLFKPYTMSKEYQYFYNAITKTNGGWDFLKNENPPDHLGYRLWRHPILDQIKINIKTINNHRDISIACYIREMKEIAIKGWGQWVDKQIDYCIKKYNQAIFNNSLKK